jgi:uncharacterized membrane protein
VSPWFSVLVGVAVIALSMVGGFFLTFSDFLMRALRMARVEAGVEVMQLINREVWRSITIVLLWGSVGLTVLVGAGAVATNVQRVPLALLTTGATVHVLGGLVVSYAHNLPMNERLASMEPSDAATYWTSEYVEVWVRWNSVRALASVVAATCFLLALLQGG